MDHTVHFPTPAGHSCALKLTYMSTIKQLGYTHEDSPGSHKIQNLCFCSL